MVPVMGMVTINCTQSQFSCKKSIPLALWDAKGNCAKGRSKEALQLNLAQFHISPNCKEREFLTEEELKQVMTHDFGDVDLAFVRDIFVFICWTALAFVDVKNLTTDNIVDINGDKWIISHRHKTMVSTNRPTVPYQVKLMDVPLQIIERYKHLQEEKFVFGKLNYWSICKKLKKVISVCGIEKQISLHCGRYSWLRSPYRRACRLRA